MTSVDAGSKPPRRRTEDGPGHRRPPATLRDVAREAGVSIATASRALNGSARNVRQENLDRVLVAAERLGYEPDLSAQAIARGSTKTAALVVADIDDPYFSSIAAGVIRAAEPAGLIVTMAVTARSPERELDIVRALRGLRPRVIIVAGSRIDGTQTREPLVEELEAYETAGGRVAMISQQDLPFNSVTIDNYGGARALAGALADLGYRRFAMICGADQIRTSRDRRSGFTAGLRRSRIMVDEKFVVEAEFTRAGGCQGARELMQRGLQGVELVFAVNDMMAIGAMTAFRDAGLVPGRDIAIAGFDDIPSAVDIVPGLTTVRIPLEELGTSAIRLALSPDEAPATIPIATTVVLRESTPRLG